MFKSYTLLGLSGMRDSAFDEAKREECQRAYDKRLAVIGGVVAGDGESLPKGMRLRPGELKQVGLTTEDALEHYKLARLWFSVGQFSGQYNLKGDAPYVPFLGGD